MSYLDYFKPEVIEGLKQKPRDEVEKALADLNDPRFRPAQKATYEIVLSMNVDNPGFHPRTGQNADDLTNEYISNWNMLLRDELDRRDLDSLTQ